MGVLTEVVLRTPREGKASAHQTEVSSQCEVVSFNLNCRTSGLVAKAPALLNFLRGQPGGLPDIIMLQEAGLVGDLPPRALEHVFPGYRAFVTSSQTEDINNTPTFNISLVTLVADRYSDSTGTPSRPPSCGAMAVRVGEVLFVNTYWPAGLDNVPVYPSRPNTQQNPKAAHVLSTIDWIAEEVNKSGLEHWFIGGDFNETVSATERISSASHDAAKSVTFLGTLASRLGAADAGEIMGNRDHTYFTRRGVGLANRAVSSRLDRFLISTGVALQLEDYRVLSPPASPSPSLSDHRAVLISVAAMRLGATTRRTRDWRQRKFIVPKHGRDGTDRRLAYHKANSIFALHHSKVVEDLNLAVDSQTLEVASQSLFDSLQRAASGAFRQTNPQRPRRRGHTRRAAEIRKAKRRVVAVVRLLHTQSLPDREARVADELEVLAHSLDKLELRETGHALPLIGTDPANPSPYENRVAHWCQKQLAFLRRVAKQVKRETHINWDSFTRDSEGLTEFASKFAKPGRPPQVRSVPDPCTNLPTEDPETVREVLLQRVTKPMRLPVNEPRVWDRASLSAKPGLSEEWKEIYSPSDNIQQHWWDSLMEAPTWLELRSILGAAKKHTSPGEGGLGVDVLQCMVGWEIPFHTKPKTLPGPVAQALLAYLTAVLRVGVFPKHLCVAWVTTVSKGSADPLNVRPVSVLPELYRLVSRLLNLRLTGVMLKHGVLHPAQRAAIADGDFYQAVDTTCNVLEDARDTGNALAYILYDQSKAFDLVHAAALRRAMTRIKLPDTFQELVLSAMARAESKVRTATGISRAVPLLRSLRQGDPLSSIMYCVFIDPLHHALSEKGGYVMKGGTKVSSLGFVDDTNVLANNFKELQAMHEVVVSFSLLNDAMINASKTYLFLSDHRGQNEDRFLLSETGATIVPSPPGTTARYLGVWINLEGDWSKMLHLFQRSFWRVHRVISNNAMTGRAAALMVNVFLVPSVQRMMRLVCFAKDQTVIRAVNRMQAALNTTFARLNRLPLTQCWKGSITPLLFGYKDLSQHAVTLNQEVIHLNLNHDPALSLATATTADRLAAACGAQGWGQHAGRNASVGDTRASALKALHADLQWGCDRPDTPNNDALTRLSLLQEHGLTLTHNPKHLRSTAMEVRIRGDEEVLHEVLTNSPTTPATALLVEMHATAPDCVRVPPVMQIDPYDWDWTSGVVRAPDHLPPQHLVVYTDGSAKLGEDSGAAAVWHIPGHASLIGVVTARLRPSLEAYEAECTGCAMALQMSPINWPLTIVCDCKSALYTSTKARRSVTSRHRVTAAARQVLECSGALLAAREATTVWRKVQAHQDTKDMDSVCNEKTDRCAKWARGGYKSGNKERLWRQGAEPALLCKWTRRNSVPGVWSEVHLAQITTRVRAHLDRMELGRRLDKAAEAKTMGRAIRYNREEFSATCRQLTRGTSSLTQARMAMALTEFLPLLNRTSYSASSHPADTRCKLCATGLKQTSRHLYSCPALASEARAGFENQDQLLTTHSHEKGDASTTRQLQQAGIEGFTRDNLIVMALASLDTQHELRDQFVTTLTRTQLRTIPHALGRLAQHWTSCWDSENTFCDLPKGTCIASDWADWLTSYDLRWRAMRAMPSSHSTTGPHPEFLQSLTTMSSPIWAVIMDGPAWLAPPSDMLWYNSGLPGPGERWWTHPLPRLGAGLRLLEWAPIGNRAALNMRAEWWGMAIKAASSTMLLLVLPADAWVTELLTLHSFSYEETTARAELWTCGSPTSPWSLNRTEIVGARIVLLCSPGLKLTKEAQQCMLDEVALSLTVAGSRDTVGQAWHDAQDTLLPARWWWGPTKAELPGRRGDYQVTEPRDGGPQRHKQCDDAANVACQWICGQRLRLPHFDRYFGNLGIPPPIFTERWRLVDWKSLRSKEADEWRRRCWTRVTTLSNRMKVT